jgi:hypothetical protein
VSVLGCPSLYLVIANQHVQGEIEFGVVNQSQSAFSHILSDVSLVVYQFESLAGFSAVVDRLGEFQETVDARGKFLKGPSREEFVIDSDAEIEIVDNSNGMPLFEFEQSFLEWNLVAGKVSQHDTVIFIVCGKTGCFVKSSGSCVIAACT